MRDFYESIEWRRTVTLAIAVLVCIFIAELFLHVPASDPELATVEFLSLGVLGANFAMGYSIAPYKGQFLRSHGLELLAFIPLWGFFRFAEMDYAVLRAVRIGSHFAGLEEGFGYVASAMRYRLG